METGKSETGNQKLETGSPIVPYWRHLRDLVIPAKAGIHSATFWKCAVVALDSRFRGNDRRLEWVSIPNDTGTQFPVPSFHFRVSIFQFPSSNFEVFGSIFRFVWAFLRSKTSSFFAPKNANSFAVNKFVSSFPLFSIFYLFSTTFPHRRVCKPLPALARKFPHTTTHIGYHESSQVSRAKCKTEQSARRNCKGCAA
jgi:hypothetical protein